MEESSNTKKKEKKQSTKRNMGFNTILSLVAYVGIGCISIALVLALIFEGNSKLPQAFSAVGQVIAYIICMVLAFSWVRTHKQIAWLVCYVVFVVTIIVLFILTI